VAAGGECPQPRTPSPTYKAPGGGTRTTVVHAESDEVFWRQRSATGCFRGHDLKSLVQVGETRLVACELAAGADGRGLLSCHEAESEVLARSVSRRAAALARRCTADPHFCGEPSQLRNFKQMSQPHWQSSGCTDLSAAFLPFREILLDWHSSACRPAIGRP
jgi:hypothetical protein